MNDPTPGNVYHRLEPGIAILSNLRAYLSQIQCPFQST